LTHRAQFQGVPWLRQYFLGLVSELVEHSRPEPGRLNRVLAELTRRRGAGDPMIDERGLLGLFASSEQQAVIDKVQALMSLLEGHGHVVMDRLGHEHLRSQERMSRVLKARRKDKRTAAFFRLTGLEMKMNQYSKGERFIKSVEREAGWDTIGFAFRGAGSLPTLEEIESPERWLRRVA
jgi:putative hydrolase